MQTGFGRTGTHFWGFQGHDVIPDMVTMAKGIGNGFPMGAVVTTPGEMILSDIDNLQYIKDYIQVYSLRGLLVQVDKMLGGKN